MGYFIGTVEYFNCYSFLDWQVMPNLTVDAFFDGSEIDTALVEEKIEQDERSRSELSHDAYESEGTRILSDIKSLYSTLEMVNKNYDILVEQRDEFTDKSIDYWIAKPEREMQDFFKEYVRRLHNYTASVHTLTHQTYTFFDRYGDRAPNLKSTYSGELNRRNFEVKVNLIKQIRHYIQKYWEPPLGANLGTSEDRGEYMELYLEKEEMLEKGSWTSGPREFLESLDEEIIITRLAEDYQQEVNEVYEWFRPIIINEFSDELLDAITAQFILEEERLSS
jgi:hypothetical protein